MTKRSTGIQWILTVAIAAFSCCAAWADEVVLSVDGFSGPEAVRYDPAQDVYFVSNFNGQVNGDANGFVSKVSPEGSILDLKFMTGTKDHPFHAGRGMFIVNSELWVVDAGGVHRFDRRSGKHVGFVDLMPFKPGFPNDVVEGRDGNQYVTDTGTSVIYRIKNGAASIATKTSFVPNGIGLGASGDLLIAPWQGTDKIVAWNPDTGKFSTAAPLDGGGNYDGIEVVNGKIVAASQKDTSLHIIDGGVDGKQIAVAGQPADIGIDTKRGRIIVPFVALNRIDVIAFH